MKKYFDFESDSYMPAWTYTTTKHKLTEEEKEGISEDEQAVWAALKEDHTKSNFDYWEHMRDYMVYASRGSGKSWLVPQLIQKYYVDTNKSNA